MCVIYIPCLFVGVMLTVIFCCAEVESVRSIFFWAQRYSCRVGFCCKSFTLYIQVVSFIHIQGFANEKVQ